jgi:hypothetical protein
MLTSITIKGNAKLIMRLLFVLLLFQSISPSIFSVTQASNGDETVLTSTHSSLIFPIFLKEQEEREQEETEAKSFDLTLLIDFSNQSLNYTAFQALLYKGYNHQEKFDCQPSLFQINSTFLI